jgi:hypothetical protein
MRRSIGRQPNSAGELTAGKLGPLAELSLADDPWRHHAALHTKLQARSDCTWLFPKYHKRSAKDLQFKDAFARISN